MASISIRLFQQSSCATIRLRISHNHTSSFINTGIRVEEDNFKETLINPVSSADRMHKEKNLTVSNFINKYENVIFDLTRSGQLNQMSATDIRDMVLGIKKSKSDITFIEYFDKFGNDRNTVKSKKSYEYTSRSLREFCVEKKRKVTFSFNELDYSLLSDFEKWMTDNGKGISTRGIIFRNIRAAYNDAAKRGYCDINDYPFKDFKIKSKKATEIQFLTMQQLQRFLSLDLSNQQGAYSLERARDIFMISFYLCGINLADLYDMPKQLGDEVMYCRKKIRRHEPLPIHIKKHKRLVELIEKHKGDSHMLNLCECKSSFDTLQRNLNHRFDRLSKLLGAKVDLAICRHTWATLCRKQGIDMYIVSKSLGHVDDDITSKYYVNYDWDDTARANDKLISAVWDGVKVNSIPTPKQIR